MVTSLYLIESEEMVEMMKVQWYYIWKDSELLEFNMKDCQLFIGKL